MATTSSLRDIGMFPLLTSYVKLLMNCSYIQGTITCNPPEMSIKYCRTSTQVQHQLQIVDGTQQESWVCCRLHGTSKTENIATHQSGSWVRPQALLKPCQTTLQQFYKARDITSKQQPTIVKENKLCRFTNLYFSQLSPNIKV